MNDVYIAYRREDRSFAERLANALQMSGLSVWWDRELQAGAGWRAKIETELNESSCVIVLWSQHSVGPEGEFVQDEAERAQARGVLLPVVIDKVKPPVGFGGKQTVDLSAWNGDLLDKNYARVRAAAQGAAAGGAATTLTSTSRRLRLTAYAATALAVFSGVMGFSNNVASVQKPVCQVGVIKACLCRPLGLGGVPTAREDKAWAAAIGRTDGDGLRTYLASYPSGAYSAEAQARLAACRIDEAETWSPDVRMQPLVMPSSLKASKTEAAAKADALARSGEEAEFICGGYAQGEYRLTAAASQAERWRCTPRDGGYSCGFDGRAVCKVQVRKAERVERCKAGAVAIPPPSPSRPSTGHG
jgi:hypothetical protein